MTTTWTIPDVPDEQLARLPWSLSQRALNRTGALRSTEHTAYAGWHGKTFDPEAGANCVVREDGPLADLVGERLRITHRVGTARRTVFVYCHDALDFGPDGADEDVSLTLGGFRRLAPLARDRILVEVAVLA